MPSAAERLGRRETGRAEHTLARRRGSRRRGAATSARRDGRRDARPRAGSVPRRLSPSSAISPSAGSRRPASMRRRLVLPAPFGPVSVSAPPASSPKLSPENSLRPPRSQASPETIRRKEPSAATPKARSPKTRSKAGSESSSSRTRIARPRTDRTLEQGARAEDVNRAKRSGISRSDCRGRV